MAVLVTINFLCLVNPVEIRNIFLLTRRIRFQYSLKFKKNKFVLFFTSYAYQMERIARIISQNVPT